MKNKKIAIILTLLVFSMSFFVVLDAQTMNSEVEDHPWDDSYMIPGYGCNTGAGWNYCLEVCGSMSNFGCFQGCCRTNAGTTFVDVVQTVTPN